MRAGVGDTAREASEDVGGPRAPATNLGAFAAWRLSLSV